MASKTKADKLDMDVEKALEQALDFEFDDDALEAILALKPDAASQMEASSDEQAPSHDIDELDRKGGGADGHIQGEDQGDDELFDLDFESLEEQIALATQELVGEQEPNQNHDAQGEAKGEEDFEKNAGETSFAEMLAAEISERAGEDEHKSPVQAGGIEDEKIKVGEGTTENVAAPLVPPRPPLMVAKKLGDPVMDSPFQETESVEERRVPPPREFPSASQTMPARTSPLGKKKSRKRRVFSSYWTTTAISLLWAVGGVATGVQLAQTETQALETLTSFLSDPAGMLVTAGCHVLGFCPIGAACA